MPTPPYDGSPFSTPAYLQGLDADLWIWCEPARPGACAYRSLWRWEDLLARFGPRRLFDDVNWICPSCGGGAVSFSLMLRCTGPEQYGEPTYALLVRPVDDAETCPSLEGGAEPF